MSDVKHTAGAVLAITEESEGQYTVNQLELQSSTGNKAPSGNDDILELHWSLGPISVDGYLNKSTWEIRVVVKVLGITVGTFVGSLKNGVAININLLAAKGQIKFYLKNGNELWIHYDLKIRFDGDFDGDKKIIGW